MLDAAEVEREWTQSVNNLETQWSRKNQHIAKKLLGAETVGEVLKILDAAKREIRTAVAMV